MFFQIRTSLSLTVEYFGYVIRTASNRVNIRNDYRPNRKIVRHFLAILQALNLMLSQNACKCV